MSEKSEMRGYPCHCHSGTLWEVIKFLVNNNISYGVKKGYDDVYGIIYLENNDYRTLKKEFISSKGRRL